MLHPAGYAGIIKWIDEASSLEFLLDVSNILEGGTRAHCYSLDAFSGQEGEDKVGGHMVAGALPKASEVGV